MKKSNITYDTIVIGLGGMGSSTIYELSKRKQNVLGLEAYDIPHTMGSSHGLTRIIRLAYNEDTQYVELLFRAYELWNETQARAREQLLYITGGIDASPPGLNVFEGALESCEKHKLEHEVYTAKKLNSRFEAFRLPESFMSVYQPNAGFLHSERCIVKQVEMAIELGATIHGRESVKEWVQDGDRIKVSTNRRDYHAERLVITAGAWSSELLPDIRSDNLVPERQVVAWFPVEKRSLYSFGHFPVWIIQENTEDIFYGFPIWGIPGFKLGKMHHLHEEIPDLNQMNRECNDDDERLLLSFTKRNFNGVNSPPYSMKSCIFTNSPDKDFIIDKYPKNPQVVFGAGFSGHGFKFASVIGEILADLSMKGDTDHEIDFLSLNRKTL